MREVHRRLAAAALLVGLLLAMTVHYGAVDALYDRGAMGARQVSDYDEHVGETAYFWGRVVRSDGETLVVRASSRTLSVRTDRTPPAGSAVQVYGRLGPGRTVVQANVVVSRPSNLSYLYAVSLVGGLLAALAFLRSWRFDRGRLAFVPREGDGA